MKLTLIAAIGADHSLGKDNQLLWHLPTDFKRFKSLTTGHTIIMGRKTFESLPKLLPNRTHIVISREKREDTDVLFWVTSWQSALKKAYEMDTNPFVIGGGEIYKMAMEQATSLEITRVDARFQADTFFPQIDTNRWKLIFSEFHPKDEKHAYDFTFETYERI